MYAAQRRNAECIQAIIEAVRARIDAKTVDGSASDLLARIEQYRAQNRQLQRRGHITVDSSFEDVVEELRYCEMFEYVNACNHPAFLTALSYALMPDPELFDVEADRRRCVDALLQYATTATRDEHERTPLIHACRLPDSACVRQLLAHSTETVDWCDMPSMMTALQYSCHYDPSVSRRTSFPLKMCIASMLSVRFCSSSTKPPSTALKKNRCPHC